MPPQPLWLLHLPRIIDELRRLETPVLDPLLDPRYFVPNVPYLSVEGVLFVAESFDYIHD